MKNAWRAQAIGVALSVAALAGCDSTQPDQIDTRGGALGIDARAATFVYNCYEIWFDTDADGVPDLNAAQDECFQVFVPAGNPPEFVPKVVTAPVPWHYSLKVSVLPAGATVENVVVSSDGATIGSSVEPGDLMNDFESLTAYDLTQGPAPPKANDGPQYWLNGREVTAGSPIYLATQGIDQGIPNILDIVTDPPTFTFNINAGDTILVRFRKQLDTAAPDFIPPSAEADLKLTATFLVNGDEVAVQGQRETSDTDGSGVTFSYSMR